MKVLFVSAEVAPFAKVGGLADVVGALPVALKRLGVDARIVMPRYERLSGATRLEMIIQNLTVSVAGTTESCKVYRTHLAPAGVPVYFIENQTYLSRGPIYNEHGTEDPFTELQRFLFFAKAVVAAIPVLGWIPHIAHCHDWHTGLVPSLLASSRPSRTASVFTIHNLAHQGAWNSNEVFRFLELDPHAAEVFAQRDRNGDFNLLQQGVLAADVVNTVSPAYAREILTPEFGTGLEDTLAVRNGTLVGILNGIDTMAFDPATDRSLRVTYDSGSIARKIENKLALHEVCGFSPASEVPTLGFVGRLTEQKGIDLIVKNSTLIREAGARLVLLGTGQPEFEAKAAALSQKHPQDSYTKVGFDAALAQQIYAGADLFLMPSKFEPCGLGQMVAMRYGTPVIAHATGGLKDTVLNLSSDGSAGLGFTFDAYDPQALGAAITRALAVYQQPEQWRTLMVRCMAQDFSWQRSAREYLALYERLL